MAPLRVVEFFSGIGGMRLALTKAGIDFEIVEAFDINQNANATYAANFGHQPCSRNIEHVTAKDIDGLRADVWTMSPPCQPHTSLGLGRDASDPRSLPLTHLSAVLVALQSKPQHIVLENVPGFHGSGSQATLLETLRSCGYSWRHFLLCPMQLGIPNERRRYYLLASHGPGPGDPSDPPPPEEDVPSDVASSSEAMTRQTLAEYLLPLDTPEAEAVPDTMFQKHPTYRFDVVHPHSTRSACVTKGYMKTHRGSGSLLQVSHLDAPLDLPTGRQLQSSSVALRFLAPRELLNLHGFPPSFAFPTTLSAPQQCALIGNSLSIDVVASLVRLIVHSVTPVAGSHCT